MIESRKHRLKPLVLCLLGIIAVGSVVGQVDNDDIAPARFAVRELVDVACLHELLTTSSVRTEIQDVLNRGEQIPRLDFHRLGTFPNGMSVYRLRTPIRTAAGAEFAAVYVHVGDPQNLSADEVFTGNMQIKPRKVTSPLLTTPLNWDFLLQATDLAAGRDQLWTTMLGGSEIVGFELSMDVTRAHTLRAFVRSSNGIVAGMALRADYDPAQSLFVNFQVVP